MSTWWNWGIAFDKKTMEIIFTTRDLTNGECVWVMKVEQSPLPWFNSSAITAFGNSTFGLDAGGFGNTLQILKQHYNSLPAEFVIHLNNNPFIR